jgi:hypothetical protein
MSDASRALQNLSGAARLVGEAAINLRTAASVATLQRLAAIQRELKAIEAEQRDEINAAKR